MGVIDDAVQRAKGVVGWIDDPELRWLAEHAYRSQVIIEVGVWKGKSTTALCHASGGRVYAIDHFLGSPEERATEHLEAAEDPDSVYRQAVANLQPYLETFRLVLIRQESQAAAASLRDLGVQADMVFLDAAHDEQSASTDIASFRPLVRPGGMLCGHDRRWPGVAAALESHFADGWETGPCSLWFLRID